MQLHDVAAARVGGCGFALLELARLPAFVGGAGAQLPDLVLHLRGRVVAGGEVARHLVVNARVATVRRRVHFSAPPRRACRRARAATSSASAIRTTTGRRGRRESATWT